MENKTSVQNPNGYPPASRRLAAKMYSFLLKLRLAENLEKIIIQSSHEVDINQEERDIIEFIQVQVFSIQGGGREGRRGKGRNRGFRGRERVRKGERDSKVFIQVQLFMGRERVGQGRGIA